MTDRARRQGRGITHLVQVLLVCVGLVTMHQMGGSTHRMAMPEASGQVQAAPVAHLAMAAPAEIVAGIPGVFTDQVGVAQLGATQLGAAQLGATGAGEATCVAVLLGLLALAVRAAVVLADPQRRPVRPRSAYSSVPLGRGPPRALLARICVLRT